MERYAGQERAGAAHRLERESGGYFAGLVPGLRAGALYSYRLDETDALLPDPASRFQPEGPHGPSRIVDPGGYAWQHTAFQGPPARGQVLYELHVGTFTREGTYRAAIEQFAELARLGVTTLELMPVAEFPGRFGWGYDGVDLWAPTRLYGEPDDLRALIDAAHGHGLAVILDVVYNHLGPDGNYLERFAPQYFTDRYPNEWGRALNFDGPESAAVREFFCENARYWIEEYRFDGLRLDATQSILDASPRHVIADITAAVHVGAAGRRVYVTAENEPQDARLVGAREDGGYGCDALWNDDFHHTAHVALTGRREAYYRDYKGTPQELLSALKWGYLYQGQYYTWQKKRRGQPALGLGAEHFLTYLQNHDQVANTQAGRRVGELVAPALLRAMTTLWLLAPPTPMLFQGQEFAASTPFLYFADQCGALGQQIQSGRREFLSQFQSIGGANPPVTLADPCAAATFERCKLDFGERAQNAGIYELHRALLTLRREDPAFQRQRADLVHGSVLAEQAFLLRFLCPEGDRLVVVNLGPDLELAGPAEPLLAPPRDGEWQFVLGSEDVKWGGEGQRPPYQDGQWSLTAASASVLRAGAA